MENNILKTRLLTASVLIALAVWMVFFAPLKMLSLGVGVITGIAAWEWSRLIPINSNFEDSSRTPRHCEHSEAIQVWFSGGYVILVIISLFFFNPIYPYCTYTSTLLLIFIVIALRSYPSTVKYWYSRFILVVLGILFLSTASLSLWKLKQLPLGNAWLITLLLLTWAVDTGAYFSGSVLGKRKFLPKVSPNKTWAGFWGGCFVGEVVVIVSGYLFAAQSIGWIFWIEVGTCVLLSAVVGDLFISMLKRCANVKDTGHILPGHGGILDRIDSLLATSIVMGFFIL